MKEVTIPVPEGKRAEWVNGVLTLVDEPKADNRPVTERIKTFEDACNELGDEHPLVIQYRSAAILFDGVNMTEDLIAYLKLRIITTALNEGWVPQFTENERRYFPWFYLCTQKEYDKMDDEEKERCVLCSGSYVNSFSSFVGCDAYYDALFLSTSFGSRLAFRTRELAIYAGIKFIEEWANFMFKPHTIEKLKGKPESASINKNKEKSK